jgi:hypothetical protein
VGIEVVNKIFLMALVVLVSSCDENKSVSKIDMLLNSNSSPVIHDYGFGSIKLLDNEAKVVRAGEFPMSMIVFDSTIYADAKLTVSFINRVPGQIVGIAMNFIDVHVYRFDSAQTSGEIIDDTYTVRLRPGINILKIAYLNSEKSGLEHEYVLGRKRVEFTKLELSYLEK